MAVPLSVPPNLGLWPSKRHVIPGPYARYALPSAHLRVWGHVLFLHVSMHAMRLSVHCTVYSILVQYSLLNCIYEYILPKSL